MVHDHEALFQPFFSILSQRDVVSEDERLALLAAMGDVKRFETGADLVSQGEQTTVSTLLVAGLAARYSVVEDGGRQITALHIPGDFVDLHSFPVRVMDHSVTAITPVQVVTFPHVHLTRITEQHAHLTRMLWMLTLIDGAIQRQWMVAKGRLSATQHMGHFFCEMYLRASIAGLVASDGTFALPLTQVQLGDTLGLSIVHTNRTLQKLRRSGTFHWDGQTFRMIGFQQLKDHSEFDPTYLHCERLSR